MLTEIGGDDFGKLEARSPKINRATRAVEHLNPTVGARKKARQIRVLIKKITLKIRCATVEFLTASKSAHKLTARFSGFWIQKIQPLPDTNLDKSEDWRSARVGLLTRD